MEDLTINYHLPILSKEELTLLYIAQLITHSDLILKYYYRDFYYLPLEEYK